MKDKKTNRKRPGVYSQIARSKGVSPQAVRESILRGSVKYAEEFIGIVKKYTELSQEMKTILNSLQKELQ